jgi:hypothetical protein
MIGGALAWLLPANPDLFLDNIILARKPTAPGAARPEEPA